MFFSGVLFVSFWLFVIWEYTPQFTFCFLNFDHIDWYISGRLIISDGREKAAFHKRLTGPDDEVLFCFVYPLLQNCSEAAMAKEASTQHLSHGIMSHYKPGTWTHCTSGLSQGRWSISWPSGRTRRWHAYRCAIYLTAYNGSCPFHYPPYYVPDNAIALKNPPQHQWSDWSWPSCQQQAVRQHWLVCIRVWTESTASFQRLMLNGKLCRLVPNCSV